MNVELIHICTGNMDALLGVGRLFLLKIMIAEYFLPLFNCGDYTMSSKFITNLFQSFYEIKQKK